MITLFIILCVILFIASLRARYKQEQIVGLSHEEILMKHRNALAKYRFWLILAIVMFVGGFLLAKCYPMYETEDYEYWIFKGTQKVLTATAWWSYILRGLAIIIAIPSLIGFSDRLKAIKKYENMSVTEYSNLQQRTLQEIKRDDEYAKKARRARSVANIIEKIFNI